MQKPDARLGVACLSLEAFMGNSKVSDAPPDDDAMQIILDELTEQRNNASFSPSCSESEHGLLCPRKQYRVHYPSRRPDPQVYLIDLSGQLPQVIGLYAGDTLFLRKDKRCRGLGAELVLAAFAQLGSTAWQNREHRLTPDAVKAFQNAHKCVLSIVKREFAESLGYIRQDIKWLIDNDSSLNYTIALLIGCGCELLAACRGDKKRLGEKVFAELLPAGDLQVLADRLYRALRNGLAHGFDTSHLFVDDEEHQIYLTSRGSQDISVLETDRGVGLSIGVRALADALCAKITDFETLLTNDEGARQRFIQAWQRPTNLNTVEAAAWRRLIVAAGIT
jgi:hypothetical protein